MHMNADQARATAPESALEAELGRAGLVVDKSIEHMLGQGLSPMAIASALLGGSMCLLARTMGDEAILHVLHNAAAGLRSGELRNGHCG
jgi:hypothetical protein